MKFNGQTREFSGIEENSTNNRMEIMAAIGVLEAIKVPCDVTIYSDSTYLVNTVMRNWKKKANLDLWERLYKLLDFHSVSMEWVRGHGSNSGNARADELAVEARLEYEDIKNARIEHKIKLNEKYNKQEKPTKYDGGCIINTCSSVRKDAQRSIKKLVKTLPLHFVKSKYDSRRHSTQPFTQNRNDTQITAVGR